MTPDASEHGFQLLQLIRSYLEIDMFMSLSVHTEETLECGEAEQLIWEENLDVSIHNFIVSFISQILKTYGNI